MLGSISAPAWVVIPVAILVVIGVLAALCVGYFWYRNWRYGPDQT